MKKTIKRLLGDPEAATLKRYYRRLVEVNRLEPEIAKLKPAALKAKTDEFKRRLADESLDKLLPEVFAVAREAAKRALGQRHYDVQIIGGICLHEGRVGEMRTGEGKTLVAVLPLYLNGLTGRGAHLVTVNDYLAQLGAGWMADTYHALGVSVGVIIPGGSFLCDPDYNDPSKDDERLRHLRPVSRQEAYAADITYGTNNEFGFDYLRDNMVRSLDQLRQREPNYAIVDEVDSILIDEARTPLIISAPSAISNNAYQQFAQIVKQLKPEHYVKDEKMRSVVLSDVGVEAVEKILGIDSLYALDNIRTIYHLEQALRAELLFYRDKNYVVTKDGEVVIVDEFTGRLLAGRRYNEGLHQAIEAKEGVEVKQESMTLAKVSFQNYFRLYDKLAGMTGTAVTEREEFYQIYELDVVSIPTNEAVIRTDHSDIIYRTEAAKFKAIVVRVAGLHERGQPVLIGTASIEKNEHLSGLLKKAKVPHQVLNAKNNVREALIVAQAGRQGAVTLATNIAGRGTDIVLGEGVVERGGLFVLGTERHESRRIDNQLRGRAGRQGDPGESQFYVSVEDDIMRIFGGDKIGNLMDRARIGGDLVIQSRLITKALEGAQKKVEGFNFDSRKYVVQYDDVMNKHRLSTYRLRRQLLGDVDVTASIKQFIVDEAAHLASLPGQDENYERQITQVLPLDEPSLDRLFAAEGDRFRTTLVAQSEELYDRQRATFTDEIFAEVQRDIYFRILDNLWMEHLESMDHMQQGVQWMSVGQRDPLVEYRHQAQLLYDRMQATLRRETLRVIFHARPVVTRRDEDSNLTRAARQAVAGAGQVARGPQLSQAEDFDEEATPAQQAATSPPRKSKKIQAQRKRERQNRKKGRR